MKRSKNSAFDRQHTLSRSVPSVTERANLNPNQKSAIRLKNWDNHKRVMNYNKQLLDCQKVNRWEREMGNPFSTLHRIPHS